MRFLGLPFLTALLACGGGSAADAGAEPLACAGTVDAYCAQHACVRRAIDRSTCETFFICVLYEVFQGEQPGELDYYDHAGALFAIVVAGTCVAGPTMFTPPILSTCAQPGPGPCDAGM